MDIKYNFIRDLVKDGEIMLEYCKSGEQAANIITKPLKTNIFLKPKGMLGVIKYNEIGLREDVIK